MSATFKRRLPIPKEIKAEMPLSVASAERKKAVDEEVAAIIKGESPKKLLIIGPCSADNEDAVLEYASRLAKAQDEVKDKIQIVMRVYTNKPRTKGTGYKGLLHQRIRKGHLTCLQASRQSVTCTCAWLRRPASSPPMRCSIRRMIAS